MPRDGDIAQRAKGGHPGGPNKVTRRIVAAVDATGEPDLAIALTMVAENDGEPLELRMEALRRLFAFFAGRVRASALRPQHDTEGSEE